MVKKWLTRLLFDWVFVLLYRMFQGFLNLVDFIESFFDVFAGTAKVFYKGNADFLINIFFGHDAVTNAFWAMALIAIVLAVGFCILQMARKATDVTGSVKQSVGQILSNFFRCLLIIIMLNAGTVAAINITNVLLDRINYALENAALLDQQEGEKTFSEQEYATMTKILATVANYSANPSADSRYNVNSCFNAIRMDLLSLHVNGFFRYDYPPDENGHYSWQGALALLASSADLTADLNLDTYYADVTTAFQKVSQEISTYKEFAPVKTAAFAPVEAIDTDVLIFLIAGMEASQNGMYNTGDFNDAIRRGYISGDKSYNNLKQVRRDFDIWEMDYLVGYVTCIVFIIIMATCIFTFIVRMFNLLLLYLTAPLFVSSMPLDDGGKWQSWTQAFVIQLFSGFGIIIAMRLYLIIIPVVISSDLVFFAGNGLGYAMLNRMAQLLMVLGGAWAVLQSGGVITGILAGNPGMAAIHQEGRIGSTVTGWATQAPRAALGAAGGLVKGLGHMPKSISESKTKRMQETDQKAKFATRKATSRRMQADAMSAKAEQKMAGGSSGADRTARKAAHMQRSADRAGAKAEHLNMKAGRVTPDSVYGSRSRTEGGDSGGAAPAKAAAPAGGGAAAASSGGAAAASGGAGASSAATPPPARSRNPYTPEMYDISGISSSGSGGSGGSGASGGTGGGGGGGGGAAPAAPDSGGSGSGSSGSGGAGSQPRSRTVAGKVWSPPSLTPPEGPISRPPKAVPFSEQIVSAVVPPDDGPSGGGSGSTPPPQRNRGDK